MMKMMIIIILADDYFMLRLCTIFTSIQCTHLFVLVLSSFRTFGFLLLSKTCCRRYGVVVIVVVATVVRARASEQTKRAFVYYLLYRVDLYLFSKPKIYLFIFKRFRVVVAVAAVSFCLLFIVFCFLSFFRYLQF